MRFKIFGKTIEIRAMADMPNIGNDAMWRDYLTGKRAIDANTALKVGAVFRCVDLLSKTMASLPLHMFEDAGDGKRKATRHRLYNIVYALPNHATTAYEFWQMFVANLLLTQGGYAKIKRNGAGFITELWNIPTSSVTYRGENRINGERYIIVTDAESGRSETLHEGEYLFVPNFRFSDDADPEDPLRIASEILGLTNDVNQLAATAFRTGINPGGFIEAPPGLSDKAFERLKEDFETKYAGVKNSGKFLMLEEGMKVNLLTRDLEKTQALESRKFAISEVCRIFGVPLHLCMDLEHATFSNIEQQSLEFVRDAINPLSVRIEQAMFRDLLTENERKKYFFKFNTNGLLRGDTAARTAYYNTMRQNGVMCADEIRELEDMNAIPGGQGAIYAINGNMIDLKNVPLNIPKGAQKGAASDEKK